MSRLLRYVCVHGHFYQPPRANPWLEAIEAQPSAHPYHDWNERILFECYRPNTAARILSDNEQIDRIVNNYSRMSFNVGPTLLDWMQRKGPDVYQAIIEADRESQRYFGGHGSAIAQAYNHMIMPLANRRDKQTQVLWGIRDFERHFGRKPLGMWLPETGVDTESLEVLAENGIEFTILAPGQGRRARKSDSQPWRDLRSGEIETHRPYRCNLPSGRSIDLFFYDQQIAGDVAFGNLLSSGARFAERLLGGAVGLAHVATDGETFGHHHHHGDMALAYALNAVEGSGIARLTNYSEYRELNPPVHEAEIVEQSSWSCAHGLLRWQEDCGCHSGAHPEWRQSWRRPLRDALDWLREELVKVFVEHGTPILKSPWEARDDYIRVILDRSPENVKAFLRDHGTRALDEAESERALELLEMQRHAMLMYTSCGWFFDDISGIETVQCMSYAARAAELAERFLGPGLEEELAKRLAPAQSNLDDQGDGERVFKRHAIAGRTDLRKLVSHYAVCSVLNGEDTPHQIYKYQLEPHDLERHRIGRYKLVAGRVGAISEVTHEAAKFSFAAIHQGGHHVIGGVRLYPGDDAHAEMLIRLRETFQKADVMAMQKEVLELFGDRGFSLASLLPEHREQILERILEAPIEEAEASLHRIYTHHATLIQYLIGASLPLPDVLDAATRFVINRRLVRILAGEEVDISELRASLEEAERCGALLDKRKLAYTWQRAVEHSAHALSRDPGDFDTLKRLSELTMLAEAAPFAVDLWLVQNVCYRLMRALLPERQHEAETGSEEAAQWVGVFRSLCTHVHLRIV